MPINGVYNKRTKVSRAALRSFKPANLFPSLESLSKRKCQNSRALSQFLFSSTRSPSPEQSKALLVTPTVLNYPLRPPLLLEGMYV